MTNRETPKPPSVEMQVAHIGASTIQGPAGDMPRPFDPQTHAPTPRLRAAAATGRAAPEQEGGE